MRRERINEGELRAAVRESALGSMELVDAVVLETAATISVIPRSAADCAELLKGVVRPEGAPNGI